MHATDPIINAYWMILFLIVNGRVISESQMLHRREPAYGVFHNNLLCGDCFDGNNVIPYIL